AQFLVDKRDQPVERRCVALAPLDKQISYDVGRCGHQKTPNWYGVKARRLYTLSSSSDLKIGMPGSAGILPAFCARCDLPGSRQDACAPRTRTLVFELMILLRSKSRLFINGVVICRTTPLCSFLVF